MQSIICFSATNWNFLFQRPQQLMQRLAREYRVAYINPPVASKEGSLEDAGFKCRQIASNLYVFTPLRPPNISRFRMQSCCCEIMNRIIEKYALHQPILWFNRPEPVYLCGRLGEKLIIYDCIDDFTAFSRATEYTVWSDQALTAIADIVFVVSESLYEEKALLNRRVYLVPNACDFEHFSKSMTDIKIPVALKKIEGPRIGFVGALYEWIDFDLLQKLAEAGKWSVVLIGPKQRGLLTPERHNLYYLGTKPYRLLPNYIKGFDVCIIPFKKCEIAQKSSPVKTYEYLASGKPVVATGIPEVEKFGAVAEISQSHDEFIRKVRGMLIEEVGYSDWRRSRQLSIAAVNTWEARCNSIKKIISNAKTPKKIKDFDKTMDI